MSSPKFYFTIHNEGGKRIDDESDYPATMEELMRDLEGRRAEKVQLGDSEDAWKLTDLGEPVYVRIKEVAA